MMWEVVPTVVYIPEPGFIPKNINPKEKIPCIPEKFPPEIQTRLPHINVSNVFLQKQITLILKTFLIQ